MKRVAIYLRVSTSGQTVENQHLALIEALSRKNCQVVAEYVDHGVSGTKGRSQRPQFDALLKDATRGKFDVIAAWSVDRLGRSLKDLIGFLTDIQAQGIDLFLYQQALDTSTPTGRAMFGMLSIFGEFEASMIRERVHAGLARARANGKRLGRPPLSKYVRGQILEARAHGHGIKKIARDCKVGVGTVYRALEAGNV
ncbi:MAG: recombinase family protein [Parvibaculum sp.]|nr:recombinase family protein [Parvibaculum sp.]